jgi:hypothetical protein
MPKWWGEKVWDIAVWVLFGVLVVDIMQSVTKFAPIPLICLKILLIASITTIWVLIFYNWRWVWHSLTGR